MDVPDVPSSSETHSSEQPTVRRSPRRPSVHMAVNIDYDNDDDDTVNRAGDRSKRNAPYNRSVQTAPLPRNPVQRTHTPTRPPTPERMRNMTNPERSQQFNTFNRGISG